MPFILGLVIWDYEKVAMSNAEHNAQTESLNKNGFIYIYIVFSHWGV